MVTYTTNKGYGLPAVGGDINAWGPYLNTNFSTLDLNLGGTVSINCAGSSDVTVSASDAKNLYLKLTGLLTGNISLILPAAGSFYIIANNTTGAYTITVKTAALAGSATVLQGFRTMLLTDGTDVVFPSNMVNNWHITSALVAGTGNFSGGVAVGGALGVTGALTGTTGAFSGALTAADGTSGTQVVNFGQFEKLLSANGYLVFPGVATQSVTIQWGSKTTLTGADTITFPLVFTNLYSVQVTYGGSVGVSVSATLATASGFRLNSTGSGAGTSAYWFAVGTS